MQQLTTTEWIALLGVLATIITAIGGLIAVIGNLKREAKKAKDEAMRLAEEQREKFQVSAQKTINDAVAAYQNLNLQLMARVTENDAQIRQLHIDLDKVRNDYVTLEKQHIVLQREMDQLRAVNQDQAETIKELRDANTAHSNT